MVNKITIKNEGGDSVRYQQNRLSQIDKHKIIAISPSDQGENRLISLSDSGELLAHPLREIKENDVAALFDLGGGDDVAKGYHKRKIYLLLVVGLSNIKAVKMRIRLY